MTRIQEWARQRGIQLNCDAKRGVYGMGLYAVEDIEEGDLVVRVPADVVVNRQNILKLSQIPDNCCGALRKLVNLGNSGDEIDDPSSIPVKKLMSRFFMSHILAVRRHEQDPVFGDWIRSLPPGQEINLPFSWEDEELQQLEGTSIFDATLAKINFLKASYEKFFSSEQLRSDIADLVRSGSNDSVTPHDLVISYFDWLLIEQWISSRCLSLPNEEGYLETVMVPIVDLCNHSDNANCRYDILEEGDVIILAERDIKKGEQLFINYGPDKGSGEFLFNYGFIPEDHVNARVLTKFYDPTDDKIRTYFSLRSSEPRTDDLDKSPDVGYYYSVLDYFANPNRLTLTPDTWKDDLVAFLAAKDEIHVASNEQGVFFRNRLIDTLDVYDFLQSTDAAYFSSTIVPRGGRMVRPLVKDVLDEMQSIEHSHHKLFDLEVALLKQLLDTLLSI